MKVFVVSMFDQAAGVYGRPAFYASVGLAVRAFTDEVNRSALDNVVFNHPADFQLFQIATFDDASGLFDPCLPVRLATAVDVKV